MSYSFPFNVRFGGSSEARYTKINKCLKLGIVKTALDIRVCEGNRAPAGVRFPPKQEAAGRGRWSMGRAVFGWSTDGSDGWRDALRRAERRQSSAASDMDVGVHCGSGQVPVRLAISSARAAWTPEAG